MSRSLFTIGWQDETDIQIYVTHSLSRLRGQWIRLPNPLLVSLWIHLVDPLLALPSIDQSFEPGFLVMLRSDELDGIEALLLAVVDDDVDESAADAALLVLRVDSHPTQPGDRT